MVREEGQLYRCEACGLRYGDREDAEACEQFCRENNACDPEITARSVDT